jgi:hypothetical protein
MPTQALFDIGNVILEPTPTFARLKGKTSAWLPLLVLIVLSLGTAKPEQRAAMERFLTPTSMLWSSSIGAVVGTLAALAVSALYYLIASKVMGVDIGYGKWFGFSVWTSVPRLLTLPLSALQIVTSHGRLAPEDLNMVSLNYLMFHLPLSHPWASLLGSLDLSSLWSIVLAVIGLKAWTGRSTGTCVLVALLPYVIVYGLWAAKIAFFG